MISTDVHMIWWAFRWKETRLLMLCGSWQGSLSIYGPRYICRLWIFQNWLTFLNLSLSLYLIFQWYHGKINQSSKDMQLYWHSSDGENRNYWGKASWSIESNLDFGRGSAELAYCHGLWGGVQWSSWHFPRYQLKPFKALQCYMSSTKSLGNLLTCETWTY